MREGWCEVRLGDVTTRRTDFTRVEADKLYRIVGVQRSGWGIVDREPARGDSMKFEKLMELHADDLVYRTITAFEAPSTVVAARFEGSFVTPQTFPVYSIDRSRLLPAYMALLTTSPRFHEEMSTRCVGTVLRRKTLSKGAFESIPLTLPPIVEQRRVVDLIAAVDDAIDAATSDADALSGCVEAMRISAIEFAEEKVEFGAVVTLQRGFDLPASARRPGDVVVMSSSGPHGHHDESPVAGPGVITGRSGTIGVVHYTDEPFWPLNTTLWVSNFHGNEPRYVRYLLQSMHLAEHAGGSTVPSLNRNVLAKFPVHMPTNAEQQRIVDRLEAAEVASKAARVTAEALGTLRSNLLTVLLSGEHEIPESYDQFLNLDEEAGA